MKRIGSYLVINMRILSIIALFLFIVQSSCTNTEQASKNFTINSIDSAFISLLQNNTSKSKHCECRYSEGSADVDVKPNYKPIFENINKDFFIKILNYSSRFCSNSTKSIDSLKNKILLLNENIFQINFYYKIEDGKVSDLISVIYCKNMYIVLSIGFREDDYPHP
jgi:hypothetical protein